MLQTKILRSSISEMGNTLYVSPDEMGIMPPIDDGSIKRSFHICLACHRDDDDSHYLSNRDMKSVIRNFLKSVYRTERNVIFTWTTWDTQNADIVLDDDFMMENTPAFFDLVVGVGCPIPQLPTSHFRAMCRLLKPRGLLMRLGHYMSSYGGMSQEAYLQRVDNMRVFFRPGEELTCGQNMQLITLHRHESQAENVSYTVYMKVET